MQIGFDAKRIFHNTTGLGNYSRDLVRILSSYYPKNKYLLYNPKPAKVNRLQIDGKIVEEKSPNGFLNKIFPSLWRSKRIVKQLVKDNVTIYHGLTGELPYGINKTNIKTIVTLHDLIFVRYPELYKPIDRYIYLKKFKYAAQTADLVVAITEQTKRDIVDFLDINPKKIQVIYQGCHPVFKEEISPTYQAEVINKYKLPENYLLNVGAINERKNVLSLIKAIDKTSHVLVIVGSGTEYYKKVRNYVRKHDMENRVFFLQGLSMQEIAVLYRKASIFIYPSLFEGFGIPIIEALYSKTPVITTNGSCFPEAGGANSHYLEDPYNTDEILIAIDNILENKNSSEKMIEKGYAFVQSFNDDNIASNWWNLYKKL